MPARRFDGTAINVALYDVLGFDSTQEVEFVKHVALASQPFSLSTERALRVRATHMQPPLLVNGPTQSDCQSRGTFGFDDTMIHLVRDFIDQIRGELDAEQERLKKAGEWRNARKQWIADQYTIRPHVRYPDEQRPYHQFSCAGLVYEAYAAAGVFLVDIIDSHLPPCKLELLKAAYAEADEFLDDENFRASKGLAGPGPWRVLLPGYLLNALVPEREEILLKPFRAVAGDEYFPSRRKADQPILQVHKPSLLPRGFQAICRLLRKFFNRRT